MRRIAAYKAKYNEDPGQFAVMGYAIMDWTLKTMVKVGPDLTADRFVADFRKRRPFLATNWALTR